jgi:hypothetical protein
LRLLRVLEEQQRPGPKEAAEKGGMQSKKPEKHPSGAKARVDFAGFMYGLKPVPFTEMSFSAACKARIDFADSTYGLKRVPFKTDKR